MIAEQLMIKPVDRNISMREESKGENIPKKICLFCFSQEMNHLTFLFLSSAVTEEFLLHQLPSLANQGNKDHFYVFGFQGLFHTY